MEERTLLSARFYKWLAGV